MCPDKDPRDDNSITRLTNVDLRKAWEDEARNFTPWLFRHIDYLSEAVGLNLQPEGMEVAVERFSADIVATDEDGSRVLIENQLEWSDHRHLGQILTYLAGLEAKYMIWVALDFQEAHRSAIRWLNDHTADDFAFFAVRVRVVQIGESPYAPIFEVVEKPNSWERMLEQRIKRDDSELTSSRGDFWNRYLERYPDLNQSTRASNLWVPMLPDGSVVLSMYAGSQRSGMFLRGPHGGDRAELAAFMEMHAETLNEAFGPNQSRQDGHYYGRWIDITIRQQDSWNKLIDWMEEQRKLYKRTLESLPGPGSKRGAAGKKLPPASE